MLPPCLLHIVREEMCFEEFYGHLGYKNIKKYALMPSANSFKSNIVWVRTSLKNFKMTAMADKGTTFAILNLPIVTISPTKFRFNPAFRLVSDFV